MKALISDPPVPDKRKLEKKLDSIDLNSIKVRNIVVVSCSSF